MNYYERFCGDYARKTAHLSLSDHGAYTIMLDTQYATEAGLPAEYADLYRICRAMDRKEQASVKRVADEFFPVSDDGLRWNDRAIQELAKAAPKIEAARLNGKMGGRPKKNPAGYETETQQEPNRNPLGFQNVTQQEPTANPTETQHGEVLSIPHTPIKPTPRRDEPDEPGGFQQFWQTYPPQRRVARAKCLTAWRKQRLEPITPTILAHVGAMKATRQWLEGYEPAPLTYLNQSRWTDGVPADGQPADQKRQLAL